MPEQYATQVDGIDEGGESSSKAPSSLRGLSQGQQQQQAGGVSSSSKKREVVSSACTACQKRKSKCDGQRPTCSQCERKNTECSFEPNDLRRVTNLRNHNHQLSEKVATYEALVRDLCSLAGPNALLALQKLNAAWQDDDPDPALCLEAIRAAHAPFYPSWGSPADGSSGAGGGGGSGNELKVPRPTIEVSTGSREGLLSTSWQGHPRRRPSQQPGNPTPTPITSPIDSISESTWHPSANIQGSVEGSMVGGADYSLLDGLNPLKSSFYNPSQVSSTSSQNSPVSGPKAPRQPLSSEGSPLAYVQIYGSMPTSTQVMDAGFPVTVDSREYLDYRIPIHLVQPVIKPENSILNRAYTDYRDAARRLISSGTPAASIVGPTDSVDVTLLFRPRRPSDPFLPHGWASEISKSFDDLNNVTKLAMAVLLTYLMRWLIDPTPESYEALPEMMRPTPTQRMVPHVPILDIIPNPHFRDAQILHFQDQIAPMAKTTRFLWTGALEECVVADQATGTIKATHEFEKCAIDSARWSWTAEILDLYPDLEGRINIWRNPR